MEEITKIIGKGGREAAKPDVLTISEFRAIQHIIVAGGIENPYALKKAGIDDSSCYPVVDNLKRKGYLESDSEGRIKATARAVSEDRFIEVTREPSTYYFPGPIRVTKLGGGRTEAAYRNEISRMDTREVTSGTWTNIPSGERPRNSVTFRLATGSWVVIRINSPARSDYYRNQVKLVARVLPRTEGPVIHDP